MTTPNITFPVGTVAAASRATYAAFIGSGFAFASWASRIPQVRDQLELSSAELGLLLLAIAVGSLIALPLAGVIVHRLGSRRTVTAMAVVLGVGLLTVALGYLIGVVPVAIGLFLVGFANGAWDVAMNVQGASVEQHLGRSIMSRYHAGFSLGTVAGAGIGAVLVLASVSVTAHLLEVTIGTAVVVPLAVRGFLPDVAETAGRGTQTADHGTEKADRGGVFRRWLEPRTLLIGVFVFAFAFAEGTGNDWIAVSLIDGYQASAAAGTVGFAVFLTAMTAGRRCPHARGRCHLRAAGVHLQPEHPVGLRRDCAVGGRHLAGVPGRDERRRRRPGGGRRPGQCGCLHRILRVPGRAAVDRVSRRAGERAQGPDRCRRATRACRVGRRRAASAADHRPSRAGGGRWEHLTFRCPAGGAGCGCR